MAGWEVVSQEATPAAQFEDRWSVVEETAQQDPWKPVAQTPVRAEPVQAGVAAPATPAAPAAPAGPSFLDHLKGILNQVGSAGVEGSVKEAANEGRNAIPGFVGDLVTGIAGIPKKAIDASAQDVTTMGSGAPMESVGPAAETAMMIMPFKKTIAGARAHPAEAPAAPRVEPVMKAPDPVVADPLAPPPGPDPLAPPAAAPKPIREAPPVTVDDEAILARIGRQPKEGLPTVSDAYTAFVDNLHPIKKAVDAATEGKPLETALNPYEQFRLTRGSAGKAEHMLRHGTLDFNTLAKNGGGLEDILKPVMAERDQLSSYLLSKRAIELADRGVDTGIPLEEARRVAAAGEGRYATVAQELDGFQSRTLDYARDSGLLSGDAVAAMREASKHYLPLYRVMDAPKGNGIGSRFSAFNPVRALKGSERQVLDPLESVIRNTYVLAEMAERNRALTSLVKFGEANPGSQIATKVKAPVQPIRIHENEVARLLDDMDIPRELYGDPTGFEVFRKTQKGLEPDEFAVYQNGKREVYKTDPEIAKIVQGLDQDQMGLLTQMASKPASWLRAGVVADPGYMARNIIRDQLNAGIQSPNGYRPFVDFMKGLMETGKKGEQYQAWLKSGGSQASMVAQDRNYATKFVQKYGADPTTGQQIKNVVTKPIELLREMSETIDNATRVGEFMRATKGKTDVGSVMKGGMASRDVTQDFQRLGAKTRGMNRITAFFNGQVQGLDREVTNLWKRPAVALATIGATVTLPSVYLWMANKDDPRYINAPNWEKDAYWMIMPEDPNAEPYRIPKPFTIGMVFGSAVERSLDAFFKDKPEAFKGFGKALLSGVTPNVIPTAAAPIIEQHANRSTFTDAPLVGQRLEKLMPERQFNTGTSEVSKLAGKGVAKIPGMEESKLASPIIIDNYIRGWGGTLGKYGTMTADKGLAALGFVDKVVGPTRKLSDIPIIKTFISNYPTAGAQPIRDFYEENARVEKLFAGARVDAKKGEETARPTRVMGFKKKLDSLQKEVREINESKELGAEAKRTAINTAYIEMLQTAQEGLDVIREARKKAPYGGPQ